MLALVRRIPVEEIDDEYYGQLHNDIDKAIERRQTLHEEELLAEDPVGQQVLRLRREREELLDTIWLATSPSDVRQLWQKVIALIGDEQTPLQTEALTITPASNV